MIKTVYIENRVSNHPRTKEVLSRIPNAQQIRCDSYKEIFNPKWVDSLQLALPCKNIKVPKQSGYLPNALTV